jgi:hypothetical protein
LEHTQLLSIGTPKRIIKACCHSERALDISFKSKLFNAEETSKLTEQGVKNAVAAVLF